MLPTAPGRRRARPSLASLAFALVVAAVSLYLIALIFGTFAYIPIGVGVLSLGVVFFYRSTSLRRRLPPPLGQGREETTSSARMARTGALIVAGGLALVVVPLATVFVFPTLFFILYLGFPLGLSLAEVAQFAWVSRLEAAARAEVYSVTELTEVDGRDAIIKRVVLTPRDEPRGTSFSAGA